MLICSCTKYYLIYLKHSDYCSRFSLRSLNRVEMTVLLRFRRYMIPLSSVKRVTIYTYADLEGLEVVHSVALHMAF
jgi:hypothetical protein